MLKVSKGCIILCLIFLFKKIRRNIMDIQWNKLNYSKCWTLVLYLYFQITKSHSLDEGGVPGAWPPPALHENQGCGPGLTGSGSDSRKKPNPDMAVKKGLDSDLTLENQGWGSECRMTGSEFNSPDKKPNPDPSIKKTLSESSDRKEKSYSGPTYEK